MAQEGSRHFGEGAFDQVEPGSMLRRMNILESARPRRQIGHGLLGDVSAVIVQNHANDRFSRVVGVERFEQGDKLPTAMAILYPGKDVTGMQVDAGQDRYSSVSDVLVISTHRRRFAQNRRQVWARQANRLNAERASSHPKLLRCCLWPSSGAGYAPRSRPSAETPAHTALDQGCGRSG